MKHRADKRGKVAKSFAISLERADRRTGWLGKKLIVHLPISVTKCVWMVSLRREGGSDPKLEIFLILVQYFVFF